MCRIGIVSVCGACCSYGSGGIPFVTSGLEIITGGDLVVPPLLDVLFCSFPEIMVGFPTKDC